MARRISNLDVTLQIHTIPLGARQMKESHTLLDAIILGDVVLRADQCMIQHTVGTVRACTRIHWTSLQMAKYVFLHMGSTTAICRPVGLPSGTPHTYATSHVFTVVYINA